MSKKPPQNFSPLAESLEFVLVFGWVKDSCHVRRVYVGKGVTSMAGRSLH